MEGVDALQALPPVPWGRQWSWVLWHADVPVPIGAESVELTCRATDSSHNTQPERTEEIWNLRGYLSNAWPKVRVRRASARSSVCSRATVCRRQILLI